MQSAFTFSLLPADVQYLIFTFLTPYELCIAAQVNSNFLRISAEDTIWKELCRRDFYWNDGKMKEIDNDTWKQQYKSWSDSTWSDKRAPEIEISTDRRTATNKYHKDQELHTSTWKSILGVSGVSARRSRMRRRFNLRVDFNPYVVACGIVPSTANVNLDLSGSNPSISLFSNGNYYAYPFDVAQLPIGQMSKAISLKRSSQFVTGDLISIIADMSVGVVEFRKNEEVLTHFLIPKRLTDIEWYPAATLSRDARITLLPDNTPVERLDLSHVFLTDMDVDETKTSFTEAQ
jgi:hypothetical protein